MTHTEALDKARKLLRLAQSDNPNEAALAASRAQEIMERFKIESISLDYEAQTAPDEPIRNFQADPLDDAGGTWRWRLAHAVAEANQCKPYVVSGGRPTVIGRPSDVATVRYIYSWLAREIDRLTQTHCAGNGRTYSNNFRIGAAETIAERIAEQRSQLHQTIRSEATNERALMVVEHSLATLEKRKEQVEAWQQAHFKLVNSGSRRGGRLDSNARAEGRRAGNSISLRPSSGSLSPGFGGMLTR